MAASYQLTTETSRSARTVEGTAQPALSEDGTSRVVWSIDDVGRGITVIVEPLEATGQFVCHRIELDIVITRAGPEDG
jgi:hypothetical protein